MNRTTQPKMTSGMPWRMILTIFSMCIGLSYTSPTPAATLLPLPEVTFFDANGNPLAAGTVQFYIPSTTTPKDTWKDAAGTILNTNPVVLDSAGRAIIYGSGSYRQLVKDSLGNTIWDQVTADTAATTGITWGGTSSGTVNAQTVVAAGFSATAGAKLLFIAGLTNTSALTVNANGAGAVAVVKGSLSGSVALTGGEVAAGNLVELDYDGTQFNIVNPVGTPIAGTLTDITSAATTDIGTLASHNANVTGVVTITSFGSTASVSFPIYFVKFASSLTLTNNASTLVIPGGNNIQTSSGDSAIVEYLGAGAWRVRDYNYVNPPFVPPPQGRLTLTSGSPVMTADVTTSASVFYTPYLGNMVPIYNGITFTPVVFPEQTLTLVAGHAANTNYDVFDAFNGTTLTTCTGPAWTSDTVRGTGAGTTELERKFGIQANKNSMTCRNGATTFTVAADFGTYLGTFRTSGSTGDTLWVANPAAAAGGGNARLYLWNMYNRVTVSAFSKDSTDTWIYTLATWRAANASNSNRISLVLGLNEDTGFATYTIGHSIGNSAAGRAGYTGIGLDSTSAWTGAPALQVNGGGGMVNTQTATFNGLIGTGSHFLQALEYSDALDNRTWYGDSGTPLNVQMALTFLGRM